MGEAWLPDFTQALPLARSVSNYSRVGVIMAQVKKQLEVWRKPRRRVIEIGVVRYGEHSVACVLRNFSDTGAALDVGVKDFVPDRFTLIIIPRKKIVSCNVIWRKGARIGVSFC
jgi:hypothetical protein